MYRFTENWGVNTKKMALEDGYRNAMDLHNLPGVKVIKGAIPGNVSRAVALIEYIGPLVQMNHVFSIDTIRSEKAIMVKMLTHQGLCDALRTDSAYEKNCVYHAMGTIIRILEIAGCHPYKLPEIIRNPIDNKVNYTLIRFDYR
jgi:hypothetical protein